MLVTLELKSGIFYYFSVSESNSIIHLSFSERMSCIFFLLSMGKSVIDDNMIERNQFKHIFIM